jgi:hypothetical protein
MVGPLLNEVKEIEALLKERKSDPTLLETPDFQATPDLYDRYLNHMQQIWPNGFRRNSAPICLRC